MYPTAEPSMMNVESAEGMGRHVQVLKQIVFFYKIGNRKCKTKKVAAKKIEKPIFFCLIEGEDE